jgi:hypothetical protein
LENGGGGLGDDELTAFGVPKRDHCRFLVDDPYCAHAP